MISRRIKTLFIVYAAFFLFVRPAYAVVETIPASLGCSAMAAVFAGSVWSAPVLSGGVCTVSYTATTGPTAGALQTQTQPAAMGCPDAVNPWVKSGSNCVRTLADPCKGQPPVSVVVPANYSPGTFADGSPGMFPHPPTTYNAACGPMSASASGMVQYACDGTTSCIVQYVPPSTISTSPSSSTPAGCTASGQGFISGVGGTTCVSSNTASASSATTSAAASTAAASTATTASRAAQNSVNNNNTVLNITNNTIANSTAYSSSPSVFAAQTSVRSATSTASIAAAAAARTVVAASAAASTATIAAQSATTAAAAAVATPSNSAFSQTAAAAAAAATTAAQSATLSASAATAAAAAATAATSALGRSVSALDSATVASGGPSTPGASTAGSPIPVFVPVSPAPVPAPVSGVSASDFCISNPNSSACATLGTAPPTGALPTGTVDVSGTNFGSMVFTGGAGTCPAPKLYSIHGVSHSYSYQPFCDFLAIFKMIALAVATFVAALIMMGQKSSDSGG